MGGNFQAGPIGLSNSLTSNSVGDAKCQANAKQMNYNFIIFPKLFITFLEGIYD